MTLTPDPGVASTDGDRADAYPLTRTQLKIYTYCRIDPLTTTYHTSLAFDITGPLDPDSLEVCIDRVVERHEMLRARFLDRGAEPCFVIAEQLDVGLQRWDHPDASTIETAPDSPLLVLNRPFALEADDMARFGLIHHTPSHHTLAIVIHHLVTDLWSMNLLCTEITDLYTSCVTGAESSLPALPTTFGTFALDESSPAGAAARTRAIAYWRKALGTGVSTIHLPSDQRPGARILEGDVERLTLGGDVVEGVTSLGQRLQCTPFVVLLSAYFAFLHRLTGDSRITVGSFFANRADPRLARVFGLLFNDLPLTVTCDDHDSFDTLVERVKDQFLSILPHANTPFDRSLVAQATAGLDHVTYEQHNTTFQLYEQAPNRLRLDGCVVVQRRFFYGSKYDLMLYGILGPDQLDLWFNFRTDKYSAPLVRAWLDALGTLVHGLLMRPEAPIGTHRLTDEHTDRAIATIKANHDAAATLPSINVVLAQQVSAFAASPAITDGSQPERRTISYRDLDAWSDHVERQLHEAGCVTGDVIAVYCSRSADLAVAHIAALKLGAICVPLNLDYPKERLRFILRDSAARVVISNVETGETFAGVRLVEVPRWPIQAEPTKLPRERPLPRADDPAYLIYTSGSRGRPKGVLLSHRGIVNQVFHRRELFNATESDTFCISLSTGFVTLPLQLFLPLFVGGHLLAYPDDVVQDPRRLFMFASDDGVAGLEVTVSQLDEFTRNQSHAEDAGAEALNIPTVMVAGEKLRSESVEQLHRLDPSVALINAYGQTECSGMTLCRTLRADWASPLDEGRSTLNNLVMILDRNGNPLPPGITGEICISGAGVGLGYRNESENDESNYINHDVFGRMFRTGDLGRADVAGAIEVLGRMDDQIKLRGVRVEPGEIEDALRGIPGITSCIVVAAPFPRDELALVAYITVDRELSDPQIRSALRNVLPEIMVPAVFCRVTELPLTPNGKIDQLALPDPQLYASSEVAEHSDVRQLTDLERMLSHLWATTLKVDSISIDDNFFALGGNSLQAVVIVSEISERLHIDLSLDTVFRNPSVGELATAISATT